MSVSGVVSLMCRSGKMVFDTKSQAKKQIRDIKRCNKGRVPNQVYLCNLCDKWHMSSMTKVESRARHRRWASAVGA